MNTLRNSKYKFGIRI